jgi:hypothetical protein
MSINPINNQNYANQSWTTNPIKGTPPQTQGMRYQSTNNWPNNFTASPGQLLAKGSTPNTVRMYDSTISGIELCGIYWDNTVSLYDIQTYNAEFQVALFPQSDTTFEYTSLIGVNSGTTDIDYIINTAKLAGKIAIFPNNNTTPVYYVRFITLIQGA